MSAELDILARQKALEAKLERLAQTIQDLRDRNRWLEQRVRQQEGKQK